MKTWFMMLLLLGSPVLGATPVPHFDEHLGAMLPLGTPVVDQAGRARTLGSVFTGHPVILWFRYLRCPQLCSVIAGGALDALRQLEASAGRDYTVVSISIDPTDTAAMAAATAQSEVRQYGRHGAEREWYLLTASPASIAALTQAAGFDYQRDPRSGQYNHPSGLLVLTPEGRISAYLTGVDFPAKALAQALASARAGRIGPSTYQVILNCLQGGLPTGKYGRLIWAILWVSVSATLVAVFGGIGWMLASEFKQRRRQAA